MNFIQGRRYRLTKDVKNPLLDRRRKPRACRLPWRADDVFFCTHRSGTATFNDTRGFRPDPIDFRHPAYAEFVAALEMLPESTDDALSSLPAWGPEDAAAIIDELVLSGKLGPLDVQVFDPAERESRFSALDEVQSLERLHDSAMTAALKSVMALKGVTGKKFDVLLPMCLDFVASMWRPLFEKIDVVHWTKMSRALKVGEDYASRLLKRNHGEDLANMIAEELVKKYSEHGFVIDIDEANSLVSHPQVSDFKLGLNAEPLQPDIYALLKIMIDSIKRAEIYSIFGGLVEVKTTPPGTGEAK